MGIGDTPRIAPIFLPMELRSGMFKQQPIFNRCQENIDGLALGIEAEQGRMRGRRQAVPIYLTSRACSVVMGEMGQAGYGMDMTCIDVALWYHTGRRIVVKCRPFERDR